MKVTFSIDQLRAVLLCAAKQDIRYYLNGVYVESNGYTTRMCATNGHQLLAVDYRHGNDDWCGNFIMPRDVCEMVCKGKYVIGFGHIDIELILDGVKGSPGTVVGVVRVQDTAIGFRSVAGAFPDYCRVITPWVGDDTDMKPGHYNPEYIAMFSKVAKMFGSKKGFFTLWQRGNDSALVNFGALPDGINAVGVLMPLHKNATDLHLPCTTQFRSKLAVEADGIAQTKDVEPVDSSQSENQGA